MVWTDNTVIGSAGVLIAAEDAGTHLRLFIVFRTGRVRPPFGASIVGDKSGAGFTLDEVSLGSVWSFTDYYSTQAEYQQALDQFASILRSEVRPVPGTGTIVGLHFHEDSLYAVRDVLNVSLTYAVQPGMYVYNSAGQIGLVTAVSSGSDSTNPGMGTGTVSIAAVDEDGFQLAQGDTISVAASIRFRLGRGVFNKGDTVSFSSGWQGKVGHVSLRDGNWESGNALGVAVFVNQTASGINTNATISKVPDDQSRMYVDALITSHYGNVGSVSSVASQSEEAVLWQSTDRGWVPAPVGGVMDFTGGTSEISADDYVYSSQTRTPGDVDVINTGNRDWTNPDNILVEGDGNYATITFSNNESFELASDQLRVDTFGFQLSDNDEVTGFEVKFKGEELSATAANHFSVWLREQNNVWSNYKFQTDDFVAGAETEELAGADGTNWSSNYTNNPPPSIVQSPLFGFQFELRVAPGQDTNFKLDYVGATMYYRSPVGAVLYLYNGSQDVGYIRRASLPILREGAWDGTGEGYLQVSDWYPYVIPAGLEIRTEQNGVGQLVGTTTTQGVLVPALPGSLALERERSRYQMISYNFFANEDRNAIYGVSGAGPAFKYDGKVLQLIQTGLPQETEKPRHVAPHQFRLALGYKWGEVYLSGVGDPLNWEGDTNFATSFAFGDKITGLMPAAGDALAVFTESSTNILLGAPGDANRPVEQKVINHKIGAIEYTVQSIGNRPIFASFRGVETLETMDEFSDFFTAPMTYDISPWLLERLQTAAGLEATDKSVVNSVVVRNKNQYRLFFADGYVLTLTLVGTEREPQNTIQQYWFESDREKYARVFATASGVTSDGRDRAFFSVEERPATIGAGPYTLTPMEVDYVYELDRGRSFDGGTIMSEFSVTHNFGVNPETGQPAPQGTSRYNAYHLHGLAHAYAALRVSRSANYEFMDDPQLPYELVTMGALDKAPQASLSPRYAKGRLSSRGFALTFHVKHESKVEFPHVIQMITLLDDQALKINR